MKATHIIPALIYNDAAAAIEFLVKAFGFEKQMVVPGEGNVIHHAELSLDSLMVMLGSAQSGSEYSKRVKTPKDNGGFVTQSPCIIVDDPDAFYERAKKHVATVVIGIKDENYGGRGFTCADPEGNLWSFGSYNPWKSAAQGT